MTQKKCDKAADAYPFTIKFVPEFCMTQEMCDKAVNRCSLVFSSFPDHLKLNAS